MAEALVSAEPARELAARLREPRVDVHALGAYLDGLAPAERTGAVRGLGRRAQQRLYAAAAGVAPLRLVDLVPADSPAGATVRHLGRNTLPLFTHFEKRFARPPGADPARPEALFGFNFQRLAGLTGPGYFVAREDPERAEVLIDYAEVPEQPPEGWPAPRPNEVGLSRFVYGFLLDRLRRVSEHVTIGCASRRGRDIGSWFVLAREV